MGEKSRPGGWTMHACIGYCKHRSNEHCLCFNKSRYEDCRDDCKNYPERCGECDNASLYIKHKKNIR